MLARYFLTFPVFAVTAAVVFNAAMGIWGISDKLSPRGLWLLTLAAGFLTIAAAWQMAIQMRDSDADKAKLNGLLTGGNTIAILSIPYAIVRPQQPQRSYVLRIGEFPLYDLKMRFVDVNDMNAGTVTNLGDFSSSITQIGPPTMEGPQIRHRTRICDVYIPWADELLATEMMHYTAGDSRIAVPGSMDSHKPRRRRVPRRLCSVRNVRLDEKVLERR